MGYLDTGKEEGLGFLEYAGNIGRDYTDRAVNAFEPLSALGQKYGGATDMYLNAMGVNGAAGNAAARNAFQTGPGYDFAFGQGMEALNRKRSAGNMYNSGNADQDVINYGQGMANQEWGNWLKNFQNFINPELAATSGAAQGVAGANLAGGQMVSNAVTNQANLTQNDATNRVNLGNTTTGNLANTNNAEAQAKMQASGNALGLGMNLLTLGTSAMGGKGMWSPGGLFGKT
jgi:hypothetical protein